MAKQAGLQPIEQRRVKHRRAEFESRDVRAALHTMTEDPNSAIFA
jgi:hypothetical protein